MARYFELLIKTVHAHGIIPDEHTEIPQTTSNTEMIAVISTMTVLLTIYIVLTIVSHNKNR